MSNSENLERAVEETAEQAVQNSKKSLTDKLLALFNSVKLNWNAPKPGEYTSIKEFMSYCLRYQRLKSLIRTTLSLCYRTFAYCCSCTQQYGVRW